jgi:hypothetical protein
VLLLHILHRYQCYHLAVVALICLASRPLPHNQPIMDRAHDCSCGCSRLLLLLRTIVPGGGNGCGGHLSLLFGFISFSSCFIMFLSFFFKWLFYSFFTLTFESDWCRGLDRKVTRALFPPLPFPSTPATSSLVIDLYIFYLFGVFVSFFFFFLSVKTSRWHGNSSPLKCITYTHPFLCLLSPWKSGALQRVMTHPSLLSLGPKFLSLLV